MVRVSAVPHSFTPYPFVRDRKAVTRATRPRKCACRLEHVGTSALAVLLVVRPKPVGAQESRGRRPHVRAAVAFVG